MPPSRHRSLSYVWPYPRHLRSGDEDQAIYGAFQFVVELSVGSVLRSSCNACPISFAMIIVRLAWLDARLLYQVQPGV